MIPQNIHKTPTNAGMREGQQQPFTSSSGGLNLGNDNSGLMKDGFGQTTALGNIDGRNNSKGDVQHKFGEAAPAEHPGHPHHDFEKMKKI
jgi:hypothetical protein